MNKVKVPRRYSSISFKDTIVLGYLLITDVFIHGRDYCRGYKKPINQYPFQFFHEYLEKIKKKKTSQITSLYRLKKAGVFEYKNDKLKTNLSEKWWQDLFNLKFRFFIAPNKWDNNWTIVTYDIPEKEKSLRRYIRTHLKKLGFVQLHRSVWITINNVERYLTKEFDHLQPHLFCFQAKNIFPNKDREIIETLFKPSRIEEKYKKYIGRAQVALKSDKLSLKIKTIQKFPKIILTDNGIPSEFFNDTDIRKKLWNTTKKLQKSII